MYIVIASFLILLTLLGGSTQSRIPATAPGYARLNNTVEPTLDACEIRGVGDVAGVVASCTTITVSGFTVPAANQPLILNLKHGTKITFTGQISFAKNAVKGYLIEITGDRINVEGSSTHQFHGHGELYWDGKGGAGTTKPTFFYLKGTGASTFNGLKIINCPERCVAIDGSNNLIVSNFLIDNKAGAPGTAPAGKEGHNTDGFDVSKTQYLTIKNSNVYNQDDCVAINDGAHMIIDNLHCDGSHGFDIATGMSTTNENLNHVKNITFQHSRLTNGMFGLHILTCSDGGKGYVQDIFYNNITFTGPSDYGVMVQQDFSNKQQKSTHVPVGNVPISNVHYKDITGSMKGQNSYGVTFRCAAGTCTNFHFEGTFSIRNYHTKAECMNFKLNGWC